MTEQEYKFSTNPENKRISDKWIYLPFASFAIIEIIILAFFLLLKNSFSWESFAYAQFAALLACALITLNTILDGVGIYVMWNPFWIRYKYYIIISDTLTYKTGEYERKTISADDVPDEHFLEELDISMQWEDITLCKVNKFPRKLTVQDNHGRKIVIGKEFKDYLKIWELIVAKAKKANPNDADVDNLIIKYSKKPKEVK
jgi:hypothetical protein